MTNEKVKPATGGSVSGLRNCVGSGGLNVSEDSEVAPRRQDQATKKWLLHRFRSAHSGVTLVLRTIEDIGRDLAADRITNEQAAYDLNAIEETPLLYLSSLLTPSEAA